jgi:hypothetical protein
MENGGDAHIDEAEHEDPRSEGEDAHHVATALTRPSVIDGSSSSSVQSLPMVGNMMMTSAWKLAGLACFLLLVLASNFALLLLREATTHTFLGALLALNVGLFLIVILGTPAQLGLVVLEPATAASSRPSLSRRISQKGLLTSVAADADAGLSSSDEDEETDAAPVRTLQRTLQAGANNHGQPTDVTARGYIPGLSMQASSGALDVNAYSDPQGPSFAVRCGPNYKRNKLKAPSGPSLFELVGMDVFESGTRIQHIAQHVDFEHFATMKPAPYVSLGGDIDAGLDAALAAQAAHAPASPDTDAPASDADTAAPAPAAGDSGFHLGSMERKFMFVVSMQVPTYEPGFMASGPQDGPGITLVWYLRATDATQADLLRAEPRVPAVRLLKGLCTTDPATEEGGRWLHRMKTIPRLVNDDDFEFNWTIRKTIKQYNGKPFLTRPQHQLHRGPGYVCYDLDIHNFCYMAKKVLFSFLDKLDRVVLDWAFTIEAYGDEEQPEAVLGSIRLFKIQMQQFPSWEKTKEAVEAKRAAAAASLEADEAAERTGVAEKAAKATGGSAAPTPTGHGVPAAPVHSPVKSGPAK